MNNFKSYFNSPIELGTRATLLLAVLEGKKINLDSLVFLDFTLLYSKNFGGPENLHPAVPNNLAEIAHRRENMPEALLFMIKRGLICKVIDETGYYYTSNNATIQFVSSLQSPYYRKAWDRLTWIDDNFEKLMKYKISQLKKGS